MKGRLRKSQLPGTSGGRVESVYSRMMSRDRKVSDRACGGNRTARFSTAAEARVGHLRSFAGEHEIDLIVERDDARVVAIEVKLAATVDDDAVRHLRWLRDRLGTDLLDAIVITTGSHAYRRPDGIGVVPAALLGP